MADWNQPQIGSTAYLDDFQDFKDRDSDAITLQKNAPSNLPDGAMKWNRVSSKFQEYNAGSGQFVDAVISIAGGGTGATDAATARSNFGLGTMSTQNNNNVTITGGTISGVTMDAGVITSGIFPLSRGGTGASLGLGANGSMLQSNGSQVVFGTDGSQLTNLSAGQLTSGTLPDSRLSGNVPVLSPTRGSLIVGNSTPVWSKLAVGSSGKFIRSDGNDPSYQLLGMGDLPGGGTWALTSDLTISSHDTYVRNLITDNKVVVGQANTSGTPTGSDVVIKHLSALSFSNQGNGAIAGAVQFFDLGTMADGDIFTGLPDVTGILAVISEASTGGFDFGALVVLRHLSHSVSILADTGDMIRLVKDSGAARLNIYWSAGNGRFEVQNKIGGNCPLILVLQRLK